MTAAVQWLWTEYGLLTDVYLHCLQFLPLISTPLHDTYLFKILFYSILGSSSTYNPICAPADVSFKLEAGENILIVGENGFGKSSLLRVISGLWKAQEGTYTAQPA